MQYRTERLIKSHTINYVKMDWTSQCIGGAILPPELTSSLVAVGLVVEDNQGGQAAEENFVVEKTQVSEKTRQKPRFAQPIC